MATLNDLTPEQVEIARRLARGHRVAATEYLERVVRRCDFSDAAPFVDEVLLGGGDAATWGLADLLCGPAWPVREMLLAPAASVLGSLDHVEGERWWRRRPTLATWGEDPRSPAVLVRATRYWQRSELAWQHNVVVDPRSRAALDRVTDPALELRRSIASCAMWAAFATPMPLEVDALAQMLGVPRGSPLSGDGHLALSGLLLELRTGLTPADSTWARWLEEIQSSADTPAPGFRASDEAFGGSPVP